MIKPSNITKYFGMKSFSKSIMEQRMNHSTFQKIMNTIENGNPLELAIANEVAYSMKEWAIEQGATHFTHWFQPQRGLTAEKHDSFLDISNGMPIQRFSGYQLIQSEPDASSFPSGGMRSTFEARGYTVWDPSSPAFIQQSKKSTTLVIPSIFLSYTGAVLDIKIPFLRSLYAIENSAKQLIITFTGKTAKCVKTMIGVEQEYFLIDKRFLECRPDLLLCGRTLIGGISAKNQQMEDHYFGAIKPRILDFMHDAEICLLERGIPVKTRHNEVAPNQFEMAPIFEEANLAVDHNLQAMEIMRQVADEHNLAILYHEKPFDGVNGSGKHMNWSLLDSSGNNLLEPSTDSRKNLQFLLFLSGVMYGVLKYGSLLRVMVADAGNDHRLGANEAPPAIMSIYLGKYLNGLLEKIKKNEKLNEPIDEYINHGLKTFPQIRKDNTDRNRTSPIAFTGNKFEFRAVGSSQNVAESATALNLLVAFGLDEVCQQLESSLKEHKSLEFASIAVIRNMVSISESVHFEGNNYDEKWEKEAKKRGLTNLKTTPEALKVLISKDTLDLFEKYAILNKDELHSKYDVKLEAYVKVLDIEMKTILEMAETMVLPALVKHLNNMIMLATSLVKANARLESEIEKLSKMITSFYKAFDKIKAVVKIIEENGYIDKTADLIVAHGIPDMNKLRVLCDQTESIVENSLWTIPKYREILFSI